MKTIDNLIVYYDVMYYCSVNGYQTYKHYRDYYIYVFRFIRNRDIKDRNLFWQFFSSQRKNMKYTFLLQWWQSSNLKTLIDDIFLQVLFSGPITL